MKRRFAALLTSLTALSALTGCSAIGDKNTSMSVIYGATAALSLLLLICYCFAAKKKDPWFLLLFSSVFVVNLGYLALAISRSLDEALLANRLAYLGSVMLPLSMWMIIRNVTRARHRKWLSGVMVGISILVFLVAASPGYLDIYYKEVSFEKVNGVTVLSKVYGPWHGLYLVYLLGYFVAMVSTIVQAALQNRIEYTSYAFILATAVFVNIGVWLIEQLVRIDFEILSISYIISESFLLGLHLLMQEQERQRENTEPPMPAVQAAAHEPQNAAAAEEPERVLPDPDAGEEHAEQLALFVRGIPELTPTEHTIFELYTEGCSTKEIMARLNIKENTLKFHNKNIYGKLGVSSRKQLMELFRRAGISLKKPEE